MDKIGDGECDSENLVGFCSFDGYDCCNVTESNKTYIGSIIDLGSVFSKSFFYVKNQSTPSQLFFY